MLTSRLVIAGAGDFARELLWLCSSISSDLRQWESMCFIDDDVELARSRMQQYQIDAPVIGKIDDFSPKAGDLLICAIGSPRTKLAVCEKLQAKGGKFTNIIHPTAAIGPRAQLGHGVIIAQSSLISVDVLIGNFVTINTSSGCGHDAVVGDGCTISAQCDITGHAHLERGVFLGSHATVLPRVRVGEFAVVGAGTVAFRDVKAGQTVIGVPAKVLL
jgi:sugar O-acyltransferase (sialic acid O-acetyltransferase NeuD family)